MPTSKFSTSKTIYKESNGDLLILSWLNKKSRLYSNNKIPLQFKHIIPEVKNKLQIVSLKNDKKLKSACAVIIIDDDNKFLFLRRIKKMVSTSIKKAVDLKLKRVVIPIDPKYPDVCQAVQEGAFLGGYIFDAYKSKKQKQVEVLLITDASQSIFKAGKIIFERTNFARDTLNSPPNKINPVTLSDLYKKKGTADGLKIDVWTESKLKKERCGGILAVGGGSATKPRLVTGSYTPAETTVNTPHIALVGKGITFDSGGYSLKPTKSMEDMKMDMAGAAMMFGAACSIAKLKLPVKISLFLPLAHNGISADSYNVSDIIKTRSGQTIEVMNTDAEGRIILSDAITLACEKKPDYLIDSATLTGAAVVALGEDIAAVYSTDRTFSETLIKASEKAGEDMWTMPLHMPYSKQYDSQIADMKNTGARWGGSIGAALFLKRFVKDVSKWIHIDIAGPGCKNGTLGHLGKGAKGFGVKSIVQLAEDLVSNHKN